MDDKLTNMVRRCAIEYVNVKTQSKLLSSLERKFVMLRSMEASKSELSILDKRIETTKSIIEKLKFDSNKLHQDIELFIKTSQEAKLKSLEENLLQLQNSRKPHDETYAAATATYQAAIQPIINNFNNCNCEMDTLKTSLYGPSNVPKNAPNMAGSLINSEIEIYENEQKEK